MNRLDHWLGCPVCSVFGRRRRRRRTLHQQESMLVAFHTHVADQCRARTAVTLRSGGHHG